jgi:hypothetical protein
MKTSMVAQDAQTFVALGRAVALATDEGALDREESAELTAGLVAGILTGGMELDTYANVHKALARLLERAFEGPTREQPTPFPAALNAKEPAGEEPLGVYLEVVGEAWDKVSWEAEAAGKLKAFIRRVFILDRATFGENGWFRAPLTTSSDGVVRAAREAGLLIVSMEGVIPKTPAEAVLEDPESPSSEARVLLGWGDRRTALDFG